MKEKEPETQDLLYQESSRTETILKTGNNHKKWSDGIRILKEK